VQAKGKILYSFMLYKSTLVVERSSKYIISSRVAFIVILDVLKIQKFGNLKNRIMLIMIFESVLKNNLDFLI
jgi:hypothetical protein